KLIYSSNTQLRLNETGKAVDRRVRCVPFNAHVEKPDYGLEARLAAEAPQVLNRLIQEAKAWYQADAENQPRFPPCSAVDRESKAYTESQNIALEFVNECCEVADGERVPGKDIYSPAYTEWCKKSGARPVGKQVFFKALQDGGFSMKEGSGHARVFERLRLKQ
ncbi:primase-like DNA-binding domain-containing protein, partial [Treponema endosymbiont of Eucomonympha sp.]